MARKLTKKPKKLGQFLKNKAFNPDIYENNDLYKRAGTPTFSNVSSFHEMVALLRTDPKIEIEANVLVARESKHGGIRLAHKKLNKEKFLEHATAPKIMTGKSKKTVRESSFVPTVFNSGYSGVNDGLVGDDFVPLLGGPFNKQLYIYDYLRMHSLAFFAYNHDPVAKFIVDITREYVLGRGFRVDVVGGKDKEGALALWRTFEDVNKFQERMGHVSDELEIYGETMLWWLPNKETKIAWRVAPSQKPPVGIIPRVRAIDPSVIWDIVTYPEDITRVLFYQWVAQTQYQIYTGTDKGAGVPTSKFIYTQIPAQEVMHYKVNQQDNEKRGRSSLFPILGYLKRLRDSVNFQIIGDQKNSAWSMDTTIEGDQADIDQYASDQEALGTIPPAGSEFIHTSKIKREYLNNKATGAGSSNSFEWCLSMIAMGSKVPVSFLGTHLSGGQTKASAIVASEPFAKKIEDRQIVLKRIVEDAFKRLMNDFGLEASCEVTFPELVQQDRSAKLKDLTVAEQNGWISKKRASQIAAKELNIDDYDFDKEQEEIKKEAQDEQESLGTTSIFQPLTFGPLAGGAQPPTAKSIPGQPSGALQPGATKPKVEEPKAGGISADEKVKAKDPGGDK